MRKAKTFLNEAQKQDLCSLYSLGTPISEVASRFGISKSYLRTILRDEGIKTGLRSSRSPYGLNETFFDDIEEKPIASYWAGFIAADGNIKKHQTLRIGISASDAPHLQKFLCDIGSGERPIYYAARHYPTRTTECATVEIGSTVLVASLLKLGITPTKTFSFAWPALSDGTMRHFLRGYFDGDGCWYFAKSAKQKPVLRFDLVGTEAFLGPCREFLERNCQLNRVQLRRCHGADERTKALSYSGNVQCARIGHFLYGDASVFLERKFEKVRPLLTA